MAAAFELPFALPHPALPAADRADRYGVDGVAGPLTARQALDRMTARTPNWISGLMALRNGLVRRVGLKTASIDGFPVLAERADEVVVGFNDGHLDFRLVLRVEPDGSGLNRVSLSTLVDRHNLLGRAYITVVTPFHKVIVKRMLHGLAG